MIIKNGIVRGQQRYKCKECGYNFVDGDRRTNEKIIAKKAMCVILYSLSKASFNMLAKIFDTWPSLVYRWIVEAGAKLPELEVSGEIRQMEFDEMWHFIGSKKTSFGSSKPLTVAMGELWHGFSAVVILKHS
jgi:transposase